MGGTLVGLANASHLVMATMAYPQKDTGRTLRDARNNLLASIMSYLPAFSILNAAYTK